MSTSVNDKPRVVDGVAALPTVLAELAARRVLIICGPSRRYVDAVEAQLRFCEVAVCDIARVHVPQRIVDEARAHVERFEPDTLVSVGGGAATGLAKALRLDHDVTFVAIPTTYSGSEHTTLYGISDAGTKRTGVDARVLPDVICLEPAFSASMNLRQSVTSLLNAFAHPISALWGSELDESATQAALSAATEMFAVISEMLRSPDDARVRARASLAAGHCARCLQGGKLGPHHRWAHALGGHFLLEHAMLHSTLLPHSIRALRMDRPELGQRLHSALRVEDLEGRCFDYLVRAGADTALLPVLASGSHAGDGRVPECSSELSSWRSRLENLGIPVQLANNLLLGRRPSTSIRQLDFGWDLPVALHGPSPEKASRVVVAYHGRGGTAEHVIETVIGITGTDERLCVIAPQSPSKCWASARVASGDETLLEYERSFVRHQALVRQLSDAVGANQVAVFGVSQGAQLALEVLLRVDSSLAAVVALSGEAPVIPPRATAADVHGVTPVLLGVDSTHPWISEDVLSHLEQRGCEVTFMPNAEGARRSSSAFVRKLLLGARLASDVK